MSEAVQCIAKMKNDVEMKRCDCIGHRKAGSMWRS